MPPYSSDSKLTRLLSKHDAIFLLELVQESLGCNTKEGLKDLVDSLQYLIPFDYALCGFAKVDEKGMSATFDTTNISYPDKWLEHYFSKEYFKFDPVVKENFTKFKIQYWQDTYESYGPPNEFVSEAEDFGLLKGYTHGVRSLSGEKGSLLSLSGKHLERDERTEAIIEVISPHLHQCYSRISQSEGAKAARLSSREKEVLKWVGEGKSTWDISKILCISERTVKFHVNNAKVKLNAVSRSHAVALAIEGGLIEL